MGTSKGPFTNADGSLKDPENRKMGRAERFRFWLGTLLDRWIERMHDEEPPEDPSTPPPPESHHDE